MAERRMFAKTIIDSDVFLDMPLSTQALYFHLNMRADDDGFINNPKKIARMIGASDDDLKLLMVKAFIIPFENGIVVIKHWRINNYIRSDRYKETIYQEEKSLLEIKDNGRYSLKNSEVLPHGIPNDYQMETQVRLGKDRLGKESIGKDNTTPLPPSKGKETPEEMFNRLSEGRNLSEPLKDKLKEWMQYKKERKEGYKETGLKSFITRIEKDEQTYGSSALIDCIDLCMARGYRGIITDLIGEKKQSIADQWKDVVL